jgi:hypothetical protein
MDDKFHSIDPKCIENVTVEDIQTGNLFPDDVLDYSVPISVSVDSFYPPQSPLPRGQPSSLLYQGGVRGGFTADAKQIRRGAPPHNKPYLTRLQSAILSRRTPVAPYQVSA